MFFTAWQRRPNHPSRAATCDPGRNPQGRRGARPPCRPALEALEQRLAPAIDFQILTLTPNNPDTVDVSGTAGDDRGGIAVSTSRVFLTGDTQTARADLDDLSDVGGWAPGTRCPPATCARRRPTSSASMPRRPFPRVPVPPR